MSEGEKAEMLRERANVSFEEARDALRACDGKLTEAYELIENHKKEKAAAEARAKAAAQASNNSFTSMNTNHNSCSDCRYYREAYTNTRSAEPTFGESLWNLIRTAFRKSVETDIVVSDHGTEKFRLPVLVFLILLTIFSGALLIGMGISLFFGIGYSFDGHGDMSRVNRVMSDVGTKASRWWENNSHISYETQQLCHKYDSMDEQNR